METLGLVLLAALSPALWQYFPKLLEILFGNKARAAKELKADGEAFRTYLITENENLQSQMITLISNNETLSKQVSSMKEELDTTVKLLEAKDKVIGELSSEVHKLRIEVQTLNNLLKK